jgi:O-antigen/teichoic acid export membrane protein
VRYSYQFRQSGIDYPAGFVEVRLPVDGESTPDRSSDRHRAPSANASRRQLFRNVVSSYASYLIGLLMTLVLTRVLLHHLGAATYGLWVVLLAIVGYLGILDVGVSTAAVQRVARLMATGDREGVADLIRTVWIFFSLSGVLAVLITVVLAPFLSSFLHLGRISPSTAGTTLIILGAMAGVMFLGAVPNAVLFGSGRSDRLSQFGLFTFLLTQLGQIIVVLAGGGLIALALVSLGGVCLGLTICASIVGRITGASIRSGHFNRTLLGDLLRFGGTQAVVSLASLVAYALDALVIGVILPVAEVAPYNIALSTATLTRSLSTQGTNLLIPTYAHYETVGDRERQAWYFFRSVMVGLVISVPITIALAAFGDPILHLWLGTVPAKTYEIMIALGTVTALQLPGNQCFVFLTGVGRNRLLMRLAIVGALTNLAGSIGATFWLGPVGPAIGSLPVVLVLDFVVLPIAVCRYLGVPVARYVKTAVAPILPVSIVASGVALALIHLHPAHSGIQAVVGAIIVVLVSWTVSAFIIFRLEPELRASAWSRLRRLRR